MTAIHSQAPHGGWVSHRPRRAGSFVGRAVSTIRDWRRRRRNRLQIATVNVGISRDREICCSDPLDLDREQKERDAWLDTLGFPPF
jgi:hypothetical protein